MQAGAIGGSRHGRAGVHRPGELTWRPAVDATRIAIGGQVVAIVALLTARAIFKAWVKARG
jgi:hypothetical protein